MRQAIDIWCPTVLETWTAVGVVRRQCRRSAPVSTSGQWRVTVSHSSRAGVLTPHDPLHVRADVVQPLSRRAVSLAAQHGTLGGRLWGSPCGSPLASVYFYIHFIYYCVFSVAAEFIGGPGSNRRDCWFHFF